MEEDLGEGLGMADESTTAVDMNVPIHKTSLPEARRLNDLTSLYRDLEKTRNTLLLLVDENTHRDLVAPLFSAALISYRRCFTQSLRTALSSSDVADSPNNAGWLHAHLLALADKLVAHSVNPFEESQTGFMVKDDAIIGVFTFSMQMVNFLPDHTKQWGRLVEEILGILWPRIESARADLDAAGRKLPITEITRAPILLKDLAAMKPTDRRAS